MFFASLVSFCLEFALCFSFGLGFRLSFGGLCLLLLLLLSSFLNIPLRPLPYIFAKLSLHLQNIGIQGACLLFEILDQPIGFGLQGICSRRPDGPWYRRQRQPPIVLVVLRRCTILFYLDCRLRKDRLAEHIWAATANCLWIRTFDWGLLLLLLFG